MAMPVARAEPPTGTWLTTATTSEIGPFPSGQSPETAQLVDAIRSGLLQEFGQVQQQMADQFQQALMMMFRMFSGMHQDQMALIREELAQLHTLTHEHQALQAKLATSPPLPADSPARASTAAEPSPPIVAAEVSGARTGIPTGAEGEPGPATPASGASGSFAPVTLAGDGNRPRSEQGQAHEDLHALLAKRIAAIQGERQGRWQKILEALMGKGTGEVLS